ncbi:MULTISPECIES: hypothetical protein [Nocardia]|nr:hypothetical protein [Nocardia sputorum]
MNSKTTKRTASWAAQASATGGTFGRPMRARHGESDHSRLQAIG